MVIFLVLHTIVSIFRNLFVSIDFPDLLMILILVVKFRKRGYRYIYFILSSEIVENMSLIKEVSIYSEIIWYHFTVYILISSFHAGITFFDNFGLSFFPKRFGMLRSCLI